MEIPTISNRGESLRTTGSILVNFHQLKLRMYSIDVLRNVLDTGMLTVHGCCKAHRSTTLHPIYLKILWWDKLHAMDLDQAKDLDFMNMVSYKSQSILKSIYVFPGCLGL